MEENKRTLIIIAIIAAVLGLALAAVLVILLSTHSESKNVTNERDEMMELMIIEKDSLQREYEDYLVLFDGFQQRGISNDSLQDELSREQQRVQDLLEELRQTKASNARKIAELKKELEVVREVAQNLMIQVDSLSQDNRRLTDENQRVKLENQQFKQENTQLTNQNTQLLETVSRASMLEMTACSLTMLNKNDRKTRQVSNMRKLQFDFTIAKNITCTPGLKDLYARIMDPEGNLLGETEEKLFHFEDSDIAYTLTQSFEYTGEEYKGVCYYTFGEEETVKKGYYTIDFFCDGNQILSFPFQLKK